MLSRASKASYETVQLEVESKFNVNALLRSQLDSTCTYHQQLYTSPAVATSLLKFTRQPDKLINDQYFDLDHALSSKSIWIRRRTERTLLSHDFPFQMQNKEFSEWEAKVRVGGDYQSSQFEELAGEERVMSLVKQHLPDPSCLQKMVDIDTFREAWTVREHVEKAIAEQDQRMLIVIDTSSAGGVVKGLMDEEPMFRHVVGEVELVAKLELEQEEANKAVAKRAVSGMLKTKLDMFMARHQPLFPTRPVPIGKLSAYFAWKKRGEDCPGRRT